MSSDLSSFLDYMWHCSLYLEGGRRKNSHTCRPVNALILRGPNSNTGFSKVDNFLEIKVKLKCPTLFFFPACYKWKLMRNWICLMGLQQVALWAPLRCALIVPLNGIWIWQQHLSQAVQFITKISKVKRNRLQFLHYPYFVHQ